jgi:hypothetical protein
MEQLTSYNDRKLTQPPKYIREMRFFETKHVSLSPSTGLMIQGVLCPSSAEVDAKILERTGQRSEGIMKIENWEGLKIKAPFQAKDINLIDSSWHIHNSVDFDVGT